MGYYCNTFEAHLHLLKWKVAHLYAFLNSSFAVLSRCGFFCFECGLCDGKVCEAALSLVAHKETRIGRLDLNQKRCNAVVT